MAAFWIYTGLFCLGAVLGCATNALVDRLCWTPRYRSPWRVWPSEFIEKLNAAPGKRELPRRRREKRTSAVPDKPFAKIWFDSVPIIGWIFLSRLGNRIERLPESERPRGLEHRLFWLRPLCVELLAAFGIVWLYHWEVERQMLLPTGLPGEPGETVLLRFAVHVVFLTLLLAATLTDLDDMTISDVLTVPGTLLGLALAALLPQTLLPATELRFEVVFEPPGVRALPPATIPLNLCSPNSITNIWTSKFAARGCDLVLMSGLWMFWCFAMLRRVWYSRLPFRKRTAIFCRYLVRASSTKWYVAAALIGPICLIAFAQPPGRYSEQHAGLLSALVGMGVGMSIIWGVRLIAGAVLGREAMGFGDVTLMGMVGAFVGWQSCLVIFFLAPLLCLALILLGALSPFVNKSRELPFGPGLCLATAILVVGWRPIWAYVEPIFELGWIVGLVMLICLILLGLLLALWRRIREIIYH